MIRIRRGPAQDIPFSTVHLILFNFKVLSKLFKSISFLFSYLNIARHNLVVELCCEQQNRTKPTVPEKINLKFFRYSFFCFFQ